MSHSSPPGPPGAPQGWQAVPPPPPQGPPPLPYGAPYPPAPPAGDEGRGLKRAIIGVTVLAVLAVLAVGGVALSRTVFEDSLPSVADGTASGDQLLGPEDVDALLEDRSKALKSGNEATFLAAFEGKAREKQRKIFRNLRKIPFAKAEYAVLKQTGTGSDDYGDGASIALDVAFVHQIRNVDVRPVAEWYRWIVKRDSVDAEPRITRVGGSPSAYGEKGFVYYPAPWDVYENMHVQRQANTIVVSDAKNAASARRFAPYVEQGARDDLPLWESKGPSGGEIPKGFLVVLEPNRKVYADLYASDLDDVGWDAGMSVPMPHFRSGPADKSKLQFGGARIKMDSSTSRFTSDQWARGVKEISRHEIAHAMLQPSDQGEQTLFTRDEDQLRTWVVEGFADYVAFRFDPQRASWSVQSALGNKEFDGKLPSQEIGEYEHSVSMDYALSYLAIRFIAEKKSERAAFRFVAEHYRNPKQLDRQLRTAVGMGTSEFERAWARYVRSVVR